MKGTLTQGSVTSTLINLTLPMIWGVFAIIAFSLADTYFVAKLGTRQLAAMSFTFPVVTLLGSVSMGLGIGAASVIARAIGEGERDRVRRLTTNSLSLSLLMVSVLVVLGISTINPVFQALGASPDILPFIREYMTIWYGGVIFLVVPMVGTSAIRAAGNTFVPSVIMTVAAVVNIILDPIFIFGFATIPDHGTAGSRDRYCYRSCYHFNRFRLIPAFPRKNAPLETSHPQRPIVRLATNSPCWYSRYRNQYDYPYFYRRRYRFGRYRGCRSRRWFWYCYPSRGFRFNCDYGTLC
ncbi:MATE family efflux transporter [Arthrospira platensis BEA 1257B]